MPVKVKLNGRQFTLSWEEFEKALITLDPSKIELLSSANVWGV